MILLNQVVLVGRLARNIEVHKSENNVKVCTICVAIPRSFKNSDGTYDTDFIDCVAFDNIAENTSLYCNKGDVVGVKGRLQTRLIENDDQKEYKLEVICEKISFLANRNNEDS